jgi:hypothetical protein
MTFSSIIGSKQKCGTLKSEVTCEEEICVSYRNEKQHTENSIYRYLLDSFLSICTFAEWD